ncbi:MAG: hypothetical protein R3F59_33315 [Myxococcota bacterium]
MFAFAMLSMSQGAWAACDKDLKALDKAEGEAVVAVYGKLAACDAAKAGEAFPAAVKKSGDTQTLAKVAVTAIDAGITEPVHGLIELIPDFPAREETARLIGSRCADDEKVVAFVSGLHDAVKDRAFVGWAGAVRTCEAPAVLEQLEQLAAAPPARGFDDKYATVVELYARKKGAEALPVLTEAAAQAAGNGGPFAVVVDAMGKAVTPEGSLSGASDADREKLVAALQSLGGQVQGDDALRRLATELVRLGADDAAGALLPKLYPSKVQSDGTFLYGVAATEACGEDAVVHWALVEDGGKRWTIDDDVAGPAKAFKGKLKKCPAEWTVQVTPEPVADADAVEAWAETVAQGAGDAKLKGEKKIVLQ